LLYSLPQKIFLPLLITHNSLLITFLPPPILRENKATAVSITTVAEKDNVFVLSYSLIANS